MTLRRIGFIPLPPHRGPGGFDHADVDRSRSRLYVAHTANGEVDVIDLAAGRYLRSIPDLAEVAGVLVHEDLVFTSNRGEDTVAMLSADGEVAKVRVGVRPNGLSYDPDTGVLLCANVGNPAAGRPPSVTLVDVRSRSVLAEIEMPGRTRWAVFDPAQRVFFVNISEPARIAVVDPRGLEAPRFWSVAARGPHGLALDAARGLLYCACDEGQLVSLDSRSGAVRGALELSGTPDVVWLDRPLSLLHVAVGDPGVVDVVNVSAWERLEVVATGPGAHTLALDEGSHRVYAFLPRSGGAAVFQPSRIPARTPAA